MGNHDALLDFDEPVPDGWRDPLEGYLKIRMRWFNAWATDMTKLTDERADGGKWALKLKEMEDLFDSCAAVIPDIAEEI